MTKDGDHMRTTPRVLLIAMLLVGIASGIDFELTLLQDRLYQPSLDSAIQPTAFLAGVEFGIGQYSGIVLRAGYSGYHAWIVDHHSFDIDQAWTHGGRVQAIPTVHVPAPFGVSWLRLDAGIGLTGAYSKTGKSYSTYEGYATGLVREHEAWTGAACFIGGFSIMPFRRMSFDVEFERGGFAASYLEKRARRIYDQVELPEDSYADDILSVGWLAKTPTAIGAGFRLGL
jgi:hypothetical protein